ncbi:hypothetical protein NHQ30_004504 [Ciborinia camelliae]|nr:hypothetical protein NHQ30_004504 [Ciborinia camelliae]
MTISWWTFITLPKKLTLYALRDHANILIERLGQCDFKSANCTRTPASNHFSNRRDVAQCGRNAPQGSQVCPLNTCCSGNGYCGTTSAYCINADPVNGNVPCQRGYGACGVINYPNCGPGSTTASNGRKVAYWQVGSSTRSCNALPISLINTQGLTHLIFAFMSISPNTFRVVPFDNSDVPLMYPFTALASATLSTYMAIGGGGSSVLPPIWSQMVSNQGNRAAFISSVEGWLSTFGFGGVDLDWEFPTSMNDRDNFVLLVRELRESFNANYPGRNWGISVVLPPDFYSLQFFNPVELEPYTNFFNFMSYDLHGPWEANNPSLGAFVRPQTSIPDITSAISPLWFAGVDPSKLNLGLAAYGRGYALSNPACNDIGCPYNGLSLPGPCSTEDGILSMREIAVLIQREGLRPTWVGSSAAAGGATGVKQIVYGGGRQWMGYDDEETWGLKMAYADELCIGGTAVWSLDLQVVGTKQLWLSREYHLRKPRSSIYQGTNSLSVTMCTECLFVYDSCLHYISYQNFLCRESRRGLCRGAEQVYKRIPDICDACKQLRTKDWRRPKSSTDYMESDKKSETSSAETDGESDANEAGDESQLSETAMKNQGGAIEEKTEVATKL